MPPKINCDMGEGFAIYSVCDDAEMMKHIDIANVACGFHASDPVVMHRTVRLAKENGVLVGAHPSYPDPQGWGRREMKIEREELRDIIIYQVSALKGFLDMHGMPLNHIKPHGALYGVAARDEEVANAVADAAEVFGVPLYGMANTLHEKVYTSRGVGFVAELYADLPYAGDGRLIIMRQPPKVTTDQVIARCMKAVEKGVVDTLDGQDIKIDFDVICVHSDTAGAVEAAKALRAALK
ncbi:MAG: 5-oxoprolinase subunit PxpA [Alphaproteobacteria bacterium]|nr:5-oxoprolinase subunit PxpA [Alphaproteobacteria bacterium]MDX5368355.1 5-oxoprolinase subunit PxpA [Alphaproteobacteria bacterium]MDX5463150.1 5-oxoprolinase subunit PxpA [Alphaproteobacteria bacterium]